MKEKLIIFTIIFAITVGVVVGYLYYSNTGHVLINTGTWTMEHSFSWFIIILICTFILFYFLVRLLIRFFSIRSTFNDYKKLKKKEQARKNLILGLIDVIEGHPQKAEKILLNNIEHSDTKLINYLLAARAAQIDDADDRRDEYLKKAHQETPEADLAIGLTQAELQLAHNQTEQALATLSHLREIAPKHIYVLKLLARLYMQLNEWGNLVKLLPEIRKHKIIPEEKLREIELTAYTAYLKSSLKENNINFLKERWNKLPKPYRNSLNIIHVYVSCLISNGQSNEAELILRQSLNRNWDEKLIQLYGIIETKQTERQLDFAEAWMRDQGRSPMLLLTLGRLCYRLRLWGKSRVYFETSIAIRPCIEAYKELGDLLITLGEHENAYHCWNEGLNLAIKQSNIQQTTTSAN